MTRRSTPLPLVPFAIFAALAGPLLAQDRAATTTKLPLTVEQVLQLQQVRSVHFGANCLVYTVLVPRPLADGPGGPYLHVHAFPDLDATLRGATDSVPVLTSKGTPGNVAVRPGTRQVTWTQPADGRTQLFGRSVEPGSETRPLANTPSIALMKWRPDGKAFAFTSLDPVSQRRERAMQQGFQQVVVDEDFRHLSLWLWEAQGAADGVAEPRVRKLTEGRTVFDFEWTPDGTALALAMAPRNLVDDSYMFQRLWLLDVAGGSLRLLVDNPGKLGSFTFSPDGRQLAYVSAADRNDPHAGMLYVVDRRDGQPRCLSEGLVGMVVDVRWPEPDRLLTLQALGTRTVVQEIRVDPRRADAVVPEGHPAQRLFDGPAEAVTAMAVQGDALALVTSTPSHPAELLLANRGNPSACRRLTNHNPWLADVALGEQSVEVLMARDGLPIEGVLIKPVGHTEGQRHPFVIVVHGGPEAHFSNGWLSNYGNWGQLLAARGYVSWYPNYRASTGYGVEFTKLDHGDPMGREFEDHLDAIEHFAQRGLVDRERVGIGGGSYGGYTAAWAATKHSRHFAAAVSFVPFVHIPTKWMTSDIPWEFFFVHYQEKWPWEQPGLLADRSPLTWAQHCRTPLLLLGGTADPRVHPSQPFMLYRAVKFATETPARYVQYPGEGHGNRTNVYQYDYALRTLQWFDWYLKGDGDRRRKAPPPHEVGYTLR